MCIFVCNLDCGMAWIKTSGLDNHAGQYEHSGWVTYQDLAAWFDDKFRFAVDPELKYGERAFPVTKTFHRRRQGALELRT